MHGVTFKKRAPRAVKEIKKFAFLAMVRYTPLDEPLDLFALAELDTLDFTRNKRRRSIC